MFPTYTHSRSPSRFSPVRCAAFILTLLLPIAAPILADQVELETGEVFKGKIIRHNEEEVSIQLSTGGLLSFKWSAIRRAKKGSELLGRKSEPIRTGERIPVKRKAPPPPLNPKAPVQPVQPITVEESARTPTQPSGGGSVETVSPDDPKAAPKEENLFTDEERRFAMAPPKGFVRSPDQQSGAISHAFVEPFTRSSLTVAAYPTADSLIQVKKNALNSYTERFKVFRVLREEKLQRDKTDRAPEAWVVEIENKLGSIVVRQVQVFTKKDRNVIVLTYSATLENFRKYEEAIGRSILTFRFLESLPEAGATPEAGVSTGDAPPQPDPEGPGVERS